MRKGHQKAAPLSTSVTPLDGRVGSLCQAVTQPAVSVWLGNQTRKRGSHCQKAGGVHKSTGIKSMPGNKSTEGRSRGLPARKQEGQRVGPRGCSPGNKKDRGQVPGELRKSSERKCPREVIQPNSAFYIREN